MPAEAGGRSRLRRVLPATLLAACAAGAQAQTRTPGADTVAEASAAVLPRWEAGLAAIAFTVPDYPASDEYRSRALPAPYVVYRGRTLRADEQGSRLRRRLAPRVEVGISGGGALSTDSGGSDARAGMPDLGYLLELGPSLRIDFPVEAHGVMTLNLAARGVISIGDPDLRWRGMLFAPELAWRSRPLGQGLSLRASLASEWASGALQDYFYEVAPQYATPERPAFRASAGYLGSSLGLRLSRRISPQLRGFAALRYYAHHGAASDDSPLFRRQNGYTAAVGLSWSFLQSREAAVAE